MEHSICTLGSHSALQILRGAKDEGFKTIVLCKQGTEEVYQQFGVADEIIRMPCFKDLPKHADELIKKKAIIIPHASLIEYTGNDEVMKLKVPYFGNKKVLEWESDRSLQREWLEKSGLKLPEIFASPKDIKKSVIVKFHGAKGGKGYFVARNEADFKAKIVNHPNEKYVIQEYIIGVPMYIHYFYSPLLDEVEIMSFDKRYESNVDSLGRISARDQIALEKVDPSYVIVGNIPLVIRESFLPQVLEMGKRVVAVSKKIAPPGIWGPFCLETILTPEMQFCVFEISARIVAGTNPYVNGSPYTWLRYNEPMSTGRRIAREIKNAIAQKKLPMVIQ
ncbi:formate--phosphoribosylaminoimidazolecarboxamide ligase [Candidatus Woesearchaeota archaeon]|nr:formate--phosphoribosylaminoimidazolecarboxamide ligase [Candidatus Woesearchaeota archaeon]